jgi:methionyl aminopeptidase
VRNLTGHSLGQFDLHAGAIIPNIKRNDKYQLREDEVYACEPFCTPGNGFVKDSGIAQIFRWIKDVPTRGQEARKVLEMSKNEFSRLPFAKRWIQQLISPIRAELAIKELTNAKALYQYFPLREISNGMVSQSEHTIIVREKPIITTLKIP